MQQTRTEELRRQHSLVFIDYFVSGRRVETSRSWSFVLQHATTAMPIFYCCRGSAPTAVLGNSLYAARIRGSRAYFAAASKHIDSFGAAIEHSKETATGKRIIGAVPREKANRTEFSTARQPFCRA